MNSPVSTPNFNPILTLNVGGTKFTTTLQTLTSNPHALFSGLIDSLPRDKEGNIFIDRDPIYFRYILDSLRMGEIQYPYPINSYEASRLWKEIDYFRLLAPGHVWGFGRKKGLRHPSLNITSDGLCAIRQSDSSGYYYSVCGNKNLNGSKFRWRILTDGLEGSVIFGIVHSTSFQTEGVKISSIFGMSNDGKIHALKKYGVEDDDEEETDSKKGEGMMKNLDQIGNIGQLNDSDDDITDSDVNSEDMSTKKLKSAMLKKEVDLIAPVESLRREDSFIMEFDATAGEIKVYKQAEEVWYAGKVLEKIQNYVFFASLKNIGDQVRIELLE